MVEELEENCFRSGLLVGCKPGRAVAGCAASLFPDSLGCVSSNEGIIEEAQRPHRHRIEVVVPVQVRQTAAGEPSCLRISGLPQRLAENEDVASQASLKAEDRNK